MLCLKIAGWVANSVDPDEMSHLGIHCLLRPVYPNNYGKYGTPGSDVTECGIWSMRYLSWGTAFPKKLLVHPVNTWITLHICPAWLESWQGSLRLAKVGNAIVFFLFFFSDFFIKAYVVGTHLNCIRQVDAIQMFSHNIHLYTEVDKKYTGCSLKTTELLDSVLIRVCVVIRSNRVFVNAGWSVFTWLHISYGTFLTLQLIQTF